MWVYPVGDFSDPSTMNKFISAFNKKNPDIKVNVDYLDYETGDDQISEAIKAQSTPDIVMEGPERIVANWSEAGLMADVSSLWTDDSSADIIKTNKVISDACIGTDGRYYEYPLCMSGCRCRSKSEQNTNESLLQYVCRTCKVFAHEALMVEPTETESKEALDSLIKAFTEIYDKAVEDPEYIKNAPHNTIIERPDEVSAARHPKLRYIPEDN